MTILQLKYVLAIAGASSMREAASKLFVSQPALSATIAGDSNLGYETIWNTFIDQVIEKDVPKDEKLVNILGLFLIMTPSGVVRWRK